jgi:alpha-L-fucosidase
MRTTRRLIIFLICTVISCFAYAQVKQTEKSMDEMWGDKSIKNNAGKLDKTRLFDDSNFGMFIHFGLYSDLEGKWKDKTYYGIGEWIMNSNMANIPVNEYKEIAKNFNPILFNAKAIVQLAKDAGMKYIIITSKHHDGFAMFKSKVDSFNIVDTTPYGRDPMKELSSECRAQGLGFGFYYSHNQDWTTPGGMKGPKTYQDGTPATFDDYFYKKCLPQVKEICSNYGPIDFVWFDTPGDMKKELIAELAEVVNKMQPNAMLCSRVGFGYGDYASLGDMEVPLHNIKGLWETCDTNNDSWSYAWYDNNFKSPKEILHRLVSTVGRGGTYLLNIGPNGKGIVPNIGANILLEVGKWLSKYPQVVYKAGPSPWGHALPWGDVTTNGNSMYLSIFDYPKDGKIYLPGIKDKISKVALINGTKADKISISQQNNWTIVTLPALPTEKLATVVELQFANKVENLKVDTIIGVAPNIETKLSVEFAETSNVKATKKSWMEKFGEWKHVKQVTNWTPEAKVVWTINVQQAGFYYVDLVYKGEKKLVWKISTDAGEFIQNQQGSTEKYQSYPMGLIEFKKAGKHTIDVSLVEGNPLTASLESLKLRPIDY